MKQDSVRKIPKRNYIIFLFLILGSFLLSIYLLKWHQLYIDSNLSVPILKDYLQETLHYKELSSFLEESETQMVYVGISDDETCRTFEKKFRYEIEKQHLQNKLVYLNLSSATIQERRTFESTYLNDNMLFHYPSLVFFEKSLVKDFFPLSIEGINEGIEFLERYGVLDD